MCYELCLSVSLTLFSDSSNTTSPRTLVWLISDVSRAIETRAFTARAALHPVTL